MSNIYYIYFYLRTDGTPYYCGKGSEKRAYAKSHTVPIPKDKSRIIIAEKNLTNIGALALERFYIRWYGRKDLGTGILRNMTDGGDGGHGCSRPHSPETKLKLSIANKGKKASLETKAKLSAIHKGRKFSDEHKAKLSIARIGPNNHMFGKKLSAEHKEKLLIGLKNKKHWATGIKFSDETKNKMSVARKGRKLSPEHRAKLSAALKGRKNGPLSPETKVKLSAAHKGKIPWNKGKKLSSETRFKISQTEKI